MKYLCSAALALAATVPYSPVFATPLEVEEDFLVMDGIPLPKSIKSGRVRAEANMTSLNLNSTSSQPGRVRYENSDSNKAGYLPSLGGFLYMPLWFQMPAKTGAQPCRPSGALRGKKPPPGKCNPQNDSECCVQGTLYPTFKCSAKVTNHTKAVLTLNGFGRGGDGGGPSECDNKFHSDDTPVVALSTGWFNNQERCLKPITIFGNGRRVEATVVDECDSTVGCDAEHDFQPPCRNNIVDASRAVWKALGVPERDWGQLDIFWSDS